MEELQVSYLTLDPLFNPKTVAVLGASGNKNKIGYLQVKALLDGGFVGEIYPINPKAETIEGLKCYPSLSAVPKQVDLAIFCVSADRVKSCLEECVQNNVKAVIIFASGFSEIGEKGLKEQEIVKELAKAHGIRLIGPNCVGILNTNNGLVGTFSPGLINIPVQDQREVGFITQSGAFGVLTYIAAAQSRLSFNYFVSVGNEVDTGFTDVIEYMIHDPKTSVISGYLEGEKNPKKLRQLAKIALEKNKPIIVMKTGRSSAGSRAAASHTGSLAGSDKIYDGFFKQTGIIRADDFEDIISFSKLFLSKKLPTGRNTVIITSSGGTGINEADKCESFGLHIKPLSEKIKTEIEKNIPSYASASNPVDLTAAASITNPEFYLEPLKVLVNDPDTDIIIFADFASSLDSNHPLIEEFIEICKNTDKFVLVTSFPIGEMSLPKSVAALEKNGIPVIPGNLLPLRALAKLVNYSEKYRKSKEETEEKLLLNKEKNRDLKDLLQLGTTLSESQSSRILESYGIRTTKKAIALSENDAIEYAETIGYPVALKIDSPDIPHKSEAKAIKLNVLEEEISNAYKEVLQNAKNYNPAAEIHGVSVQEMLPEGVEVIVGATNDPTFGPVIMLGLGGIFVEVFKDVSFRVAPLTKNDCFEMIEELMGASILKGVRGKPAVDIEAIVDTLLKVSELVTDYGGEIHELDINPLIVYEKGIVAADAMLVVREPNKQTTVVGGE